MRTSHDDDWDGITSFFPTYLTRRAPLAGALITARGAPLRALDAPRRAEATLAPMQARVPRAFLARAPHRPAQSPLAAVAHTLPGGCAVPRIPHSAVALILHSRPPRRRRGAHGARCPVRTRGAEAAAQPLPLPAHVAKAPDKARTCRRKAHFIPGAPNTQPGVVLCDTLAESSRADLAPRRRPHCSDHAAAPHPRARFCRQGALQRAPVSIQFPSPGWKPPLCLRPRTPAAE